MNQNLPDQALRKLLADLDKAWDARDAHAFAQLFEPDADFGSHGAPLLKGRDAIEQHYAERVFPQLDPAYRHRSRILYTRSVSGDVIVGDAEVDIYSQDGPEPDVLYVVPAAGVFVRAEGSARSLASVNCRSPISPTARISAFWPPATTGTSLPNGSRSCSPPDPFVIRRDVVWESIGDCRPIPSDSVEA